jgi:hypothetical protein
MKEKIQIIIFASFLVLSACLFRYFSGPFYFGNNSDPSYFYLYNFLYLLEGRALEFVDHPGTTLDLLGAAVLKIFFPIPPHTLWLSTNTLKAEAVLHFVWFAMIVLYAATLVALGFYTLKRSQDRYFTGLVLLGGLWLVTIHSFNREGILPISANVNSDTMMMTAINFMIWAVLGFYFAPESQSLWQAVSLGLAVVFGLATKFTALPFLFMAFFILVTCKQRILFFILTAGGFVLLTFPIWGNYGHLIWWVKGLILDRGMHGSIGQGFDAKLFLQNLWWVIKNHWFFVALWILSGVFAFRARQSDPKIPRILSALAIGGLVQAIIVAKQTSFQYMAPMVGMSSLCLAFLFKAFPDGWRKWGKPAMMVILAVSLGLVLLSMWQVNDKASKTKAMLETIARDYTNCRVCPFYRSSTPGFGLVFWERLLDRQDYSAILKTYYPDLVFYDIFGKDFKDSAQQVVPLAVLRRQAPRVLLYGSDIPPKSFEPYLIVKKIYTDGSSEALYEVVSGVSYLGVQYLQYAKLMYSQSRYADAFRAAVISQQLGVGQDLGPVIEFLRQKIQTP